MKKRMQESNFKVLVISISNPILIGIYENNILLKSISKEGKTSDILPSLFNEIITNYNIKEIFYVNGPGSYMAIKIAYIFLKSISIIKKINLYAVSGFCFNNDSPIKALGKKYFFREFHNSKEKIVIKFLGDAKLEEFLLPQSLENIEFTDNTLPEYNLPAV